VRGRIRKWWRRWKRRKGEEWGFLFGRTRNEAVKDNRQRRDLVTLDLERRHV
jgi:hypothetical protein